MGGVKEWWKIVYVGTDKEGGFHVLVAYMFFWMVWPALKQRKSTGVVGGDMAAGMEGGEERGDRGLSLWKPNQDSGRVPQAGIPVLLDGPQRNLKTQ